ncbi:MAG: hypothetical protein ACI8UO_003169 [Verrucomicrobiales bacterium]|jgi:hypothetical protein
MDRSSTILGCLQSLDAPAPVSALQRALKEAGESLTLANTRDSIAELVSRSKVWEHTPNSARGKARFWLESPKKFTLTLIQNEMESRGRPMTITGLKNRVAKPYRKYVDEVLGEQIGAGELFEFRKGSAPYISKNHPGPRELLTAAQLKTLGACVQRLRQAGSRKLTLDGLLNYLENGSTPPPSAPAATEPEPTEAIPDLEELRAWFQADLPSLGGLRTMPFSKTWLRYSEWSAERNQTPSLDAFHGLLRGLAKKSIVALTPHDEPARLPEADQQLLMNNSDGSRLYYFTIFS